MPDQPENFLSRWSRRKRTGEEAGLKPDLRITDETPSIGAPEPVSANPSTVEVASLESRSPDAPADPVDIPENSGSDEAVEADVAAPGASEHRDAANADGNSIDVESIDFEALDFESDYERFMDHGVNDETRNKALRKLWVSNPVLANIDGLDDYCEDYTDAAVCLPKGVMKTAYQFGRGFLNDQEVAEWEALGKPVDPVEDDAEGSDGEDESVAVADASSQVEAEQASPELDPENTGNMKTSAQTGSNDAAPEAHAEELADAIPVPTKSTA
ncbi:MAG: DUF3306 domain-containing protein [Pseudomonadota bacterium]